MKSLSDVLAALDAMPIVAILRGLPTVDAPEVAEALIVAGIKLAEVPLNSPDPFRTIALLQEQYGDQLIVGAGTVTQVAEVVQLAETGATLCVSPHCDPTIIRAAIAHNLVPIPGFQTATEAFSAIAAGATLLKFFPAASKEHDLRALRAVLPSNIGIVAVGGVSDDHVPKLKAAGAIAFGVGSDLYRPGKSTENLLQAAAVWTKAASLALS